MFKRCVRWNSTAVLMSVCLLFNVQCSKPTVIVLHSSLIACCGGFRISRGGSSVGNITACVRACVQRVQRNAICKPTFQHIQRLEGGSFELNEPPPPESATGMNCGNPPIRVYHFSQRNITLKLRSTLAKTLLENMHRVKGAEFEYNQQHPVWKISRWKWRFPMKHLPLSSFFICVICHEPSLHPVNPTGVTLPFVNRSVSVLSIDGIKNRLFEPHIFSRIAIPLPDFSISFSRIDLQPTKQN